MPLKANAINNQATSSSLFNNQELLQNRPRGRFYSFKLLTIDGEATNNFKMKIFLILFFIGSNAFAESRRLQTFVGTFKDLQHGDYIHLNMYGHDKKITSFICSDLPKNLVKGISCFEVKSKFKEKTLVITFHKESSFIPEAQKKITWNYVDRIDLR